MKKIELLTAAALSILAAVSCAKETSDNKKESANPGGARTTLSASLLSTRTALGEKEGTAWPNYWKEGDQISVNGVTSDALGEEADGKATATFSFEGALETPYYAAYPASALTGYENGSATLTVPATQAYVEGSYDPAAFVMGGKSTNAGSVVLSPCVSIFHLSLSGSAAITSVRLTGAEGSALSGTFTTDFSSLTPASVSHSVEMTANAAVSLPAEFFICIPAGLTGPLQVEIFDVDGGSMSIGATVKSALVAGQMYSPATLPYAPTANLTITAEGITSSTAIICWTGSAENAYTVSVYADAGCTTLVDSYTIDAGNACWGEASPRFCISGLDAGTTYYVKVTGETLVSNVLPVSTAEFEIVEVSDTPAQEGDVILAEDFSELRWDSDIIGRGVGYFPTSQDSFSNTEVSTYQQIKTSNEKVLSAQATALANSRLAHWAQGAHANLYIHPGYIKLVGSKKVTHIVTPALDNIPEGLIATVEVKVSASAYYSESDGKFATTSAVVAVQPAGEYNELTGETNTNTLDLTSNIQPITLAEETAWNTYTITLEGVVKGDRLAFGAAADVTGNNARMNINDIQVSITALEEPGLNASVKGVSSSTATFTWTYGGEASADIAKPYTIALYSDASCTQLVVSHAIEADNSCWDGKKPCFVFGGLNPSTEYWFVATDTEANISSEPVSATTDAFTVVDATTVSDATVGDVILAEDFSEIGTGPDEFLGAASYFPSSKVLPVVPSGANPAGSFIKSSSTGDRIFGAGWDLGSSRLSKGWGFAGNSSVYYQNGFLRVGVSATTSATARTHIVTPALSGIPAGKLATIEVTVTTCKYESSENDVAVFAENNLTINSTTNPSDNSFRKYSGQSLSEGNALGITAIKSWETKTVTINNVDSDYHLLIGSLEHISGKNRFYLSDVKVQITALADDPVMKIMDEATFNAFVSAVATDKTIPAKVTQSFTVSSATAEAFASIEDYEGTFDGNGHTITGLTKPMFNELKGTVKDLTLNSTINITADQQNLGMLANILSGTVEGCTSKGSVTFSFADVINESQASVGEHRIGGLIGMAASSGATVIDCTNEAAVTNEASSTGKGELMVGGVLGTFWGTDFVISGCENTGAVSNNANWAQAVSVGGIVGQTGNDSGASLDLSASDCTNSGAVSNTGNSEASNNVGGIIGWIRFGTFSGNSNTGDISNSGEAPSNYVGGLFGYLDKNATFDGNSNSGLVSNSGFASYTYKDKTKMGGNFVGGLLGRMQTDNIFKNNTNSGTVQNSGDANHALYIGGIVGYLDKNNKISDAGNNAKYKLKNSGDIENSGSAKDIFIGGLFGRNSSGNFNMTGTSSVYSTNSGNITDTSGPAKSNGGDLCIGGIAGYTTTGIKTQYARNSGDITVHGDKGNTYVNVGGIGGWISNASFNFNNCRNTGDVTIDCTTSTSIWAAGIVGCPKNNNTLHYYWYSNAVIDTHAATVGGDNYTAGLMGAHEGSYDSSNTTFHMYGHKLAGTVWGSTTTTGLFCCTKNTDYILWVSGGSSHPNTIAPGTVRKDNTHDNTVNSIDDVTLDILSGGAGSSAIAITDPETTETDEAKKPKKVVTLAEAIESSITVAEW